MQFRFSQFLSLFIATVSLNVSAAGLGDINLLSRMGEPLRAEIPIYADAGQSLEYTCFSLATKRGADLPVITSAQTYLAKTAQGYRLMLTGKQPINAPAFIISVRANCGVSLQRDYVLIPDPPLEASSPPATSNATVHAALEAKRSGTVQWLTRQGDTLESIAQAKSYGDPTQFKKLLTGIKQANPNIETTQSLSDNAIVLIPNMPRAQIVEHKAPPIEQRVIKVKEKKSKPPRNKALANLDTNGHDRVTLGSELELSQVSEAALSQHIELRQMEMRMLQMETSLKTLDLQIENLNAAIDVTAETVDLREKLRVAQTQQAPSEASTALSTTQAEPEDSASRHLLELGVSALIGGLLAIIIAQLGIKLKDARAKEWLAAHRLYLREKLQNIRLKLGLSSRQNGSPD